MVTYKRIKLDQRKKQHKIFVKWFHIKGTIKDYVKITIPILENFTYGKGKIIITEKGKDKKFWWNSF